MPAPGPPNKCACEAWQLADLLWVLLTEDERQLWRDAVLRPGISGYDLFMGWNAFCFNAGLPSPGTPPPSGGFAYDESFCTGGYLPPEICVKPGPPPPWPPGEPCPHCTYPNPRYLHIEFSGFAGDLAPINGAYILDQATGFPCHFSNPFDQWNIDIGFDTPGAHEGVLDVSGLATCAIPLECLGANADNCGQGESDWFFNPAPDLCPIPEAWYDEASYWFEGSEP